MRIMMRGQHRRQPLLRLLLLYLLLLSLCGRLRVRRRGRVTVLLELADVDRAPFVWELFWTRARMRALEQTTLVAKLVR